MKLFYVEDEYIKVDYDVANYIAGNKKNSSTIKRIRDLVAQLYNYNAFPPCDLFGLIRNCDSEHAELVLNIIEFCGLRYGDTAFILINDIAPIMLENNDMK